jgi:hypothetical protein
MRIGWVISGALVGLLLGMPRAGLAQAAVGQAFIGEAYSGTLELAASAGDPGMANEPSGGPTELGLLYAKGMRAIDEGRWSDAEAIFTRVAGQANPRADGALYWKAYAENKLGQTKSALDTCYVLDRNFPASSWIHECGALEIEIHAKSGKPAEPKPGDDDDLKLLALNSLLRIDEPRAMAEIQEILNGDSSEKLKKEAQFILGQHYSDATYAQIVRLSYVEGDVRIARGKQNERITGATWEKAEANLPLEAGFILATGNGRAEIELEDASTLYLGENSVLIFNDLHTTGGVPHAELALLAGTLSAHVIPYSEGQSILLRTLTDDRYLTSNPGNSCLRVSSYVDATAVTPLDGWSLRLGGEAVPSGQTVFLRDGRRVTFVVAAGDPKAFADWDKWVAGRIAQRNEAMAEVMQASGLAAPIPGLAEMRGSGRFFECEPYGTCWEPSASAADREQQTNGGSAESKPSTAAASKKPAKAVEKGSTSREEIVDFPCLPATLSYRLFHDPVTGREKVVYDASYPQAVPYRWAVCHAGSWIHQRNHYVWVVGHKRHHIEPVRWVKSGRTVAYVPIHPYDVKGRPPINRKDIAYAPGNRNEIPEPVKLDNTSQILYLERPPREYRGVYPRPLQPAEAAHMETYSVHDRSGSNGAQVKPAGIPLSFDHKSHSILMPTKTAQGNKTTTVLAPVSNRSGSLQPRGGSFSGGGGSHGGGGYSGTSGGGNRGGGGSSGGSHSGGGSTGSSGGGSHGGGGGSSSSGGSSSGVSSGGSSSVSTPSGASSSSGSHR